MFRGEREERAMWYSGRRIKVASAEHPKVWKVHSFNPGLNQNIASKVHSFNPGLNQNIASKVHSFNPGLNQNIALHAVPADGNSSSVMSVFSPRPAIQPYCLGQCDICGGSGTIKQAYLSILQTKVRLLVRAFQW